ncbi:MAG: UDP-N-acetylmuramate--L-alanine ligase [Thermomicrobium sp.]
MKWPRHLDWLTVGAPVHFLGIGGSGMSGLAELLAAEGYQVSGCDAVPSPVLEQLAQRGISITIGHSPAHVEDAALLVVTSAVRAAHPEVTAFAIRRRPIVKRAALLGWFTADYLTIAVAGTHGKSTTSGMIALALEVAGLRPGFAIGATVRDLGGTSARPSRGRFFVVEADEYDYSFLALEPYIAVVLNVDHDHPDLFPSHGSVVRAFRRFLERLRPDGVAVLAADDPVTRVFASELSAASRRVFTFGTAADAQYRLLPDGSLREPDGKVHPLDLMVPGWHNRLNAAAAVAAGVAADVPVPVVLQALRYFTGIGRRFEEYGVVEGVPVILDYAHHPREVVATIAAARERYPEARLWAVFQPHTYSRTQLFLDQFAQALEQADIVVVTDVYPAREVPLPGVNGVALAQRIQRVPAIAVPDPEAAAATVRAAMHDGDVVLVLGAGDIWKAAVALREGERNASAR